MITICTSTFYNFVNDDKIENFNMKLLSVKPHRKQKNDTSDKEGKKEIKINSIENRTFLPNNRDEFGHWEGDTVVGSSKIENSGDCFTLVERKTRYQIVVKMKDRKSDTVLKAVKKIKTLYTKLMIIN